MKPWSNSAASAPPIAAASASAFAALAALLLPPVAATWPTSRSRFLGRRRILAFRHALVLPLVDPLAVGFVALAVTIGYRFGVADKDKRFLRKSFALYLAPAVIERMMESEHPPVLGGEVARSSRSISPMSPAFPRSRKR